jgi:hypothetical protein
MHNGELVGIAKSNNGRRCSIHPCCGAHLKAGDVVKFKFDIVTMYEGTEDEVKQGALKAVKLENGVERCTVGFLPRHLLASRRADFENACARILMRYDESDNSTHRRKYYAQGGMASFSLIVDKD